MVRRIAAQDGGVPLPVVLNYRMANDDHIAQLMKGVDAWNTWRKEKPGIQPDLMFADLSGADLSGADLSYVFALGAELSEAILIGAKLSGAILDSGEL